MLPRHLEVKKVREVMLLRSKLDQKIHRALRRVETRTARPSQRPPAAARQSGGTAPAVLQTEIQCQRSSHRSTAAAETDYIGHMQPRVLRPPAPLGFFQVCQIVEQP